MEALGGARTIRMSEMLVYLSLLGDFEDDINDSDVAYNAALFVVSHPGIFEYRTRKMVRDAYEERFDGCGWQLVI
ncbi:hypothetical protein N7471_012076 [Penicillium samsonianum]|uniref:uncharacterized protein n=1 Tax=Penicillium samsonianum TaxID=1882272 RepID=UPI00254729E6|nr:uncharacterized protein N7471_012076 [Penicillium samsonianum]KAJ6124759.1 hypothetical protein N7471_012076 [Penicillium samsonianum]